MKQPNGASKASASRSCRNLFLDHPDLESGTYWIDPNLGCTDDAIEAHCEKETMATCVIATQNQVTNATWYTGAPKKIFFNDMRGGLQFSYTEEASQLTFLRLLSVTAKQTATFYCKDVDSDLEFLTSDKEISRNYEIESNCQRGGSWGKAVISLETENTDMLPWIDFSVPDVGSGSQAFGMDMGRVCFA